MVDAAVELDSSVTPFAQTTLQTVTDADGAVSTFLQELWNRSDIDTMVYAQVGLFQTSSGGSYSLLGRNITSVDPGTPINPGGGFYINIFDPSNLKNFRIQAQPGGTIYLTGVAYR